MRASLVKFGGCRVLVRCARGEGVLRQGWVVRCAGERAVTGGLDRGVFGFHSLAGSARSGAAAGGALWLPLRGRCRHTGTSVRLRASL